MSHCTANQSTTLTPRAAVTRKKESGRAKKAENEAKKQEAAAAEKDRKEVDKWSEGAKSKKSKEDKEAKRREELARKAENARLLAEEEAIQPPKPKSVPKAGAKKSLKDNTPAGPGAIAAGGGPGKAAENSKDDPPGGNGKLCSDWNRQCARASRSCHCQDGQSKRRSASCWPRKASRASSSRSGGSRFVYCRILHHARFSNKTQAAFEAYKERELPNLKVEHPGLRLQQYLDLLYKQFQKSPDNPFNQATVAHDASKEERTHALKEKQDAVKNKMRVESD
ncbi:hypothetical protein JVU11DRAFT_164 [Chiua virens]|nr:hypothetical protein JVU11DRAFT_164 [Chiua virens]